MPEGLSYTMTITDVSRNSDGYDVKAEVEERIYAHNAVRFQIPKDHVRLFPLGEVITVTVSFGLPVLAGKL